MTCPDVIVIRTGTANVASILAALGRLGAAGRISSDPQEVQRAARLVLPGVGTFGAAMARLGSDGLVGPLRKRLDDDRPTLAVCVGMQLLFETSEESPGVEGLRALAGTIEPFSGDIRVPQMGWNNVTASADCRVLTSGYLYFANSYRLAAPPDSCAAAMADYGGQFVAALERGHLVACQFHPELSGMLGLDIMRRWLDGAGQEGPSC